MLKQWCYRCGRDIAVRGGKYVRQNLDEPNRHYTARPCNASGTPPRARHNVDVATR